MNNPPSSSTTDELMRNFEQQYAGMSAEITAKIGTLGETNDPATMATMEDIRKLLGESDELLEQMDLEIRSLPTFVRSKYVTRVASYKCELERLRKCYDMARRSDYKHSNNVDFYADFEDANTEQTQSLLDATECVERTGKHLVNGYRIALETEQIGSKMLNDLHSQRETINSTFGRLHETNSIVRRSSQILRNMVNRSVQHKIVLLGIAFLFFLIVAYVLYLKL